MRYIKLTMLVVFAAGTMMMTGCAGARNRIVATTVTAPVSFTDAVPTSTGEFYSVKNGDLEVVGSFEYKKTKWATGFSWIPLFSKTVDISDFLNKQLAEKKGDAIVHLRIESRPGLINLFSGFIILSIIVPGDNVIYIKGDVVKLAREKAQSLLNMPMPATLVKEESGLKPVPAGG